MYVKLKSTTLDCWVEKNRYYLDVTVRLLFVEVILSIPRR